jgi:hypothetical protein
VRARPVAALALAALIGSFASSGRATASSATATGASGVSGLTGGSGVSRPAVRRSITLAWVGDIAFGESYGLPPGGLAVALAPVRAYLRSDLTMGNLETTLAYGGEPKCARLGPTDCFNYEAPPIYARELKQAGFDLLNDANNHALDFGLAGRSATLAALHAAGLAYDGLPGQITRLRINGISVAVIGFAPYSWTNNLLDIPQAEQLVRAAKREARLVIVIIHAGAEGASEDHVPYGTEYDYGEDRGDSRVCPRRDRRRRIARDRLGTPRDPRDPALPRSHDRLLAGELRQLGQPRPWRHALGERDPAGDARP